MLKKVRSKVILGISPGTRLLGFAIIQDGELRDWGVMSFKEKWSKAKLKRILAVVENLVISYGVNIVVLKKVHPSRTSKGLHQLVTGLEKSAKVNRIKIYRYTIVEIKDALSPDERINKKVMAEMIVAKFPELNPELIKEHKSQNTHYTRMFEAAGLDMACLCMKK